MHASAQVHKSTGVLLLSGSARAHAHARAWEQNTGALAHVHGRVYSKRALPPRALIEVSHGVLHPVHVVTIRVILRAE